MICIYVDFFDSYDIKFQDTVLYSYSLSGLRIHTTHFDINFESIVLLLLLYIA